jgi:large subunit ribosomal protein L1
MDVAGAIAELKQGRMEFRADKGGVVNMSVGKVSMDAAKIAENAGVFIDEVTRKRPSDLRGQYIRSVSCSSTMGPGVKVSISAGEES